VTCEVALISACSDLHSKYLAGLDSKPELRDLMNEVAAKIPSRWRSMGIQLGVDTPILDAIASISQGEPNKCFELVFTHWEKQKKERYPYTWLTIVETLQLAAVGENRLAEEIRTKLTGIQSSQL